MTSAFKHKQSLINYAFNAYRVAASDEADVSQACYKLPGSVLSTTLASDGPIIGHRIAKDRASSARYLVNGRRGNHAAYVDENGFVVLIVLEEDGKPTFSPVFRIPKDRVAAVEELPGLVGLERDRWLCSHGDGSMSLIEVTQQGARWVGHVRASWRRMTEEGNAVPFRVQAARAKVAHEAAIQVVLQRTMRSNVATSFDERQGLGAHSTSTSSRQKMESSTKTSFELALATLMPSKIEIEVDCTYDVDESPYLIDVKEDGAAFIFADSEVRKKSADVEINQTPPTKKQKHQDTIEKAHIFPYAWAQTEETVTMTMQLPENVRRQDVTCNLDTFTLTLRVDASTSSATIHEISDESDDVDVTASNLLAIRSGVYTDRRWSAEIDANNSLWTIEKASSANASTTLTLHLEKKHTGTRWTNVFHSDGQEEGVSETMDPSELSNMLDGLRKYTEDRDEVAAQHQPSLLQDGLEDEDANVGRACVVSYIDAKGMLRIFDRSATTLAVPVSHSTSELIVRRDLDGLTFDLTAKPFEHVDTMPALSYVLASKQNLQRTYFYRTNEQPSIVLAVDASINDAGQASNLFVYHSPLDVNSGKIASDGKSSVIRLESSRQSGAFVDANVLTTLSGQLAIVLLCQHQLIVILRVHAAQSIPKETD